MSISRKDNSTLGQTIQGCYRENGNIYDNDQFLVLDNIKNDNQSRIIDGEISVHKTIKVNGQIYFDIVVFNISCKVRYRKKGREFRDTEKLGDHHEKYLGIRVCDLFKIFHTKRQLNEIYEDPTFKGDDQGIYKKAIRFDPNDEPFPFTYETRGYSKNQFKLMAMHHKGRHDMNYFLNGVVFLKEFFSVLGGDIHSRGYRFRRVEPVVDEEQRAERSFDRIQSLVTRIDESVIQKLLDLYYFNDDVKNVEAEVLVFDEPRSLLSLLKEYETGEKHAYYRLRKLTKGNTRHAVTYPHLDKFGGQVSKIAMFDWGKVYLKQFSPEKETDILCSLVWTNFERIRKKNDRAYYKYDDKPYCPPACLCRYNKYGGKRSAGGVRRHARRELKELHNY